MNRDQAIQAAQQIGVAPGQEVWMQSEGQIGAIHGGPGNEHVDGWAVRNNNGQLESAKLHSNAKDPLTWR